MSSTVDKQNQDGTSEYKIWVIVPAAGSGQRMGVSTPKQYLQIHGKTILETTLALFLNSDLVEKVVVTRAADDLFWPTLPCAEDARIISTVGGSTRAQSVYNGLQALKSLVSENDWVLVHDAARPCLSNQELDAFIHQLSVDPVGGILAMRAKDTLKLSKPAGSAIHKTIDREDIWHAQTPQMFRYELLVNAMEQALNSDYEITDEASAMELAGHHPCLIESNSRNLKITTSEDLAMAEFLLRPSSN